MKRAFCGIILAGAISLFPFNAAYADDYQNGVTAFEQGDHALALSFWLPLAENGHDKAQYSLGKLYETPEHGEEPKFKEAMKWYEKAASQGVAAAQNNLGRLYAQGKSGQVDQFKAVGYWRMAADEDHAMAQYNLGLALFRGEGVEQNIERAVFWFHQSANKNVSGAQYALGEVYRLGLSVPTDYQVAEKWYQAAVNNGNTRASEKLKKLSELAAVPVEVTAQPTSQSNNPETAIATQEEKGVDDQVVVVTEPVVEDLKGGSLVVKETEEQETVSKPEIVLVTSSKISGVLAGDVSFRPKKNPRRYAGVGNLLIPKPKSNPRR